MVYKIITLTSIPDRLSLLHTTLSTLLNQSTPADKIYLQIPHKYHNYPVFDKNLIRAAIPSNAGNVQVNRCLDRGPATKLTGLFDTDLFKSLPKDTLIIVCDDDRLYPSHFVEQFVKAHLQYPEKALTVAGWELADLAPNLPPEQRAWGLGIKPRGKEYQYPGYTDVLGGCCGFALPKALVPRGAEFLNITPDKPHFYQDDIWISGHLTKKGVPIYIIGAPEAPRQSASFICDLSSRSDFTRTRCNEDTIQAFKQAF